jgi:hypothetical protein
LIIPFWHIKLLILLSQGTIKIRTILIALLASVFAARSCFLPPVLCLASLSSSGAAGNPPERGWQDKEHLVRQVDANGVHR